MAIWPVALTATLLIELLSVPLQNGRFQGWQRFLDLQV